MSMTFEDLETWKKARELVNALYVTTRNDLMVKDFGLCSQIQRAGVSIMSNIAEGFERRHLQEKLQFYNIARGSAAEVRSLLYVIGDNYPGLLAHAAAQHKLAVTAGKLVTGLIHSTEARKPKTS